jgi:SH3-like domain-containing protein
MSRYMSVQVKKCQLRNKPSFLGKVVADLNYGARVTVEQEQDSWLNISPESGMGGWVHSSALSEKKIILDPSSREVTGSASHDEIALAGKGFNEQVEKQFKKENSNIDFSWIDKMELIVVEPEEIHTFLQEGEVEGGART